MCRPPRSTERGDPADFSSCASIHLGLASWTRPSGGHYIRGLRGDEAAALFYSLIESAKLAGVELRAYLGEATRRATK